MASATVTREQINPQDWSTVQPEIDRLLAVELTQESTPGWLKEWSDLAAQVEEAYGRAVRASNENTTDEEAEQLFLHFVEEIGPKLEVASQALRQKLLEFPDYRSPADQEEMLRRFRNEAELFRDENVPIQTELGVLTNEYNKIVGAMTVTLDGEELTLPQAELRLLDTDRARREEAWRAMQARRLQDRQALDDLYLKMLPLRRQLASNSGLPDYRTYVWRQYGRFDYSPEDCLTFHDA